MGSFLLVLLQAIAGAEVKDLLPFRQAVGDFGRNKHSAHRIANHFTLDGFRLSERRPSRNFSRSVYVKTGRAKKTLERLPEKPGYHVKHNDFEKSRQQLTHGVSNLLPSRWRPASLRCATARRSRGIQLLLQAPEGGMAGIQLLQAVPGFLRGLKVVSPFQVDNHHVHQGGFVLGVGLK